MTIPIQNFEAETLVILKRCDYDAYLKKFCVKKKRLCQIHFYKKKQNMFLCRILTLCRPAALALCRPAALRRFQWYQPFKEITTSHALFSFFFHTKNEMVPRPQKAAGKKWFYHSRCSSVQFPKPELRVVFL